MGGWLDPDLYEIRIRIQDIQMCFFSGNVEAFMPKTDSVTGNFCSFSRSPTHLILEQINKKKFASQYKFIIYNFISLDPDLYGYYFGLDPDPFYKSCGSTSYGSNNGRFFKCGVIFCIATGAHVMFPVRLLITIFFKFFTMLLFAHTLEQVT